ncbi:ATPase, partial [Frankia sp. AiPs1]|nr:ATPase [Frankia sp. AiPs1]
MLDGFQFHRILATPRRPEGTDRPDPVPPALFAALVGAHAELTSLDAGPAGPGIAVAWLRGPGESHIRFLAGGRPYFPPGTIRFPSGTIPAAEAAAAPRPQTGGWPDSEGGGLPALPPFPGPPRPGHPQSGHPQLGHPRPGSTPRAAGPAPLLYPPGSTAVALASGAVLDDLARFPYWLRCGGSPDALWAPGPGGEGGNQPPAGARRGAFDDYAAHLVGPFAWLVLAWPVAPHRLAEERDALARSIPALRLREHDQDARLELERAERRHRELGRAAASGMWDVEILVGGASRAGAFSLAALLCSSSDLDELPYTLRPLGPATSFAGAR